MSNQAYIKLVKASKQQSVTIDDVKNLLHHYRETATKTGQQLDWNYGDASFPYEVVETTEGKGKWFSLKAKPNETSNRYRYIVLGVDEEEKETEEGEHVKQAYIQLILPEGSTHGDKCKANEFCKYLANKLAGELHMFNGRVMYFYKR